MTLDQLRKQIARSNYENFYRALRNRKREFGLIWTMRYALREIARLNRQRAQTHIVMAHKTAFKDFLRNCPEIDVTPTGRDLRFYEPVAVKRRAERRAEDYWGGFDRE